MAMVISIITLLAGIICLLTLPVEQYPDIAPPTIYVSTSYTGADANAVMKSVIMPLEESINGVEHMMYMVSEATSTGDVTIQVYFEQGTNADMATVNVQNRVSKVLGMLPAEVTQVGVQVYKRQNSMLQIGSLVSTDDKFDQDFIANYLDISVIPQIKRINGVGNVNNLGNTYSLRIWLKPDMMAMYGLTPDEVNLAIQQQNLVAAAGSLGESSDNIYQYTMEYRGRLVEIEEFENIVIKAKANGNNLYLKDIADVELGAVSYSFNSTVNQHQGVVFIVSQVAGANATQVNQQIDQLYKDMESQLPPGLEFKQLMTSNDFLFAAIHNVVETLIIAIFLVILVVFFFLQDFKATLIPSISIIVSLVGTFAIVKIAGFSLNILTLFALVLAIGTVVDDAIVVVEAVMAKFEAGYKDARLATTDALHEVFSAVISCTLVFMAVFIPVTFMPGTSGTFFTQFGVTLAASVGLSCVNALTLCPALCAILMRSKDEEHKGITFYVKKAYNASFTALSDKYFGAVGRVLHRTAFAWIGLAIAAVLLVWLMKTTPSELVPQEDQGLIMVNVSVPPGYSLAQTNKVASRIEERIKDYEEAEVVSCISGYGMISGTGSNYATIIIRLKNWDERKGRNHSVDAICGRILYDCRDITEANILTFQPPQIPGYGTGNSIQLIMQDRTGGDMSVFAQNVNDFVAELQKRPEISVVFNTYDPTFPKYQVNIDANICERAGISTGQVLQTLGAYCGGSYISNYNQYGKIYRVMMEAGPEYRLDANSLDNMYVRVGNGEMSPISQFVTLEPKIGSSIEKRFNLFASNELSVNPAQGYSSGQAMKAIEEVFNETMPKGYGYEYGGLSREQAKTSNSNATALIYCICILLIYLILACLYNSWFIPLSVLLSVPFGLMGAFAIVKPLTSLGFTNNIYLQTGVIMLIGLLSKTAILITEFAVAKRKQGLSIFDAAFEACKDRFRPILMTVLSMVIGMIPLIIESGAGSMGNRSLALGVVGGMVVGTISLIFVVPIFYMIFQKLHERFQSDEPDEIEVAGNEVVNNE